MANKAGKEDGKIGEAPLWMWSIGFLGLALTLGSIVFVLYEAAAGDSSPPDIAVRVDSIAKTRNGFLVKFSVINHGGSTAEGLTVEGELKEGPERIEISGTTIEYVPSHSEREGGLFFTSDPRRYEMQIRPKGYEKP